MAFLWPEKSEVRARGSLRQALHTIRLALGTATLVTTRQSLSLGTPPANDLHDFLQAARTGDDRTAALLYGGPLLQHVSLSDASEAELWIDIERRRLAQLFESLALRVLRSSSTQSNHAENVLIATRFREAMPESAESWRLLFDHLIRTDNWAELRLQRAALKARISTNTIDDLHRASALLGTATPQYTAVQEAADASRLRWPSDGEPTVGRQEELALLNGRVLEIGSAAITPVLLTGRSGIGKSHLLRVFASERNREGMTIAPVRASRWMQDDALSLARELVQTLSGLPGSQGVSQRTSQVIRALLEHEHAESIALHAYNTGNGSDIQASSERVQEALTDLLRCIAGEAPCLLTLDDLQWSDQQSIAVILAAARGVVGAPLMVIGASRVAIPTDQEFWHVLRVGPLKPEHGQMLFETLAPSVSPSVSAAVQAWALGVPLLYEQAAAHLAALNSGLCETSTHPDQLIADIQSNPSDLPGTRIRIFLSSHPDTAISLAALALWDSQLGDGVLDNSLRSVPSSSLSGLLLHAQPCEGEHSFSLAHDSIADAVLRMTPRDARSTAAAALVRKMWNRPLTRNERTKLIGIAEQYDQGLVATGIS